MTLTKKQRERRSLDAVLQHLGMNPTPIDETEEPDFIFSLDSTTIGAEITELYLPSAPNAALPEQAKENEERLMVEMARQKAIQVHVPAQHLQLRLSAHFLTKRHRTTVAAEVCDFVAANFALPGEVKSIQRHELPPSIVHITLYGLRNTPHTWNGSCSGWVNSRFATGFQEAIDKKESLRPKYLTRCNKIWLITVATHAGGSSFIEWSMELAALRFSAKFDRIFFVEGLSDKVRELQIALGTA